MGSRGPQPNWNLGKTRQIRVPEVIADDLIKIARRIDNGEQIPSILSSEEAEALRTKSNAGQSR